MELVILAAGMGSRFGGLKQIEPIDEYNNFIIDYSVYDAIESGFDKVIFIIKEELLDDFKKTIDRRIENKIKTEYVFQKLDDLPEGFKCPEGRTKPWGTGQAILAARHAISGPFMIINADDFYGKESFKVAANYMKSLKPSDVGKYANVTFKAINTLTENGSVKRGVCNINEKGELVSMIESSIEQIGKNQILAKPLDEKIPEFVIDGEKTVSMNMFIFTKDLLTHLEERFVDFLKENEHDNMKCEYLIPSVVSDLNEEGKASVKILTTPSTWYGVTYKEDKEGVVKSIKKLVDSGHYKKGLWK